MYHCLVRALCSVTDLIIKTTTADVFIKLLESHVIALS